MNTKHTQEAEMANTKRAKVTVATVYIDCPKCDEPIAHQSGSHLWEVNQLPASVRCFACGGEFKLPKSIA